MQKGQQFYSSVEIMIPHYRAHPIIRCTGNEWPIFILFSYIRRIESVSQTLLNHMYAHTVISAVVQQFQQSDQTGNCQWKKQNFVHSQKQGGKISLIHYQN